MGKIQSPPTEGVDFTDTTNPWYTSFIEKLKTALGLPIFVDLGSVADGATVTMDFSANRDYRLVADGNVTLAYINEGSRSEGTCTITIFRRDAGSATITRPPDVTDVFEFWNNQWSLDLSGVGSWVSFTLTKNANGLLVLY